MDSDTLIEKQIQSLDPLYRSFVESDFIEIAAKEFGQVHILSTRQIEVLENAIFLYLIMIFTRFETIDFISKNCDLPFSEAEILWVAIESIFTREVTLATKQNNPTSKTTSVEPVSLSEIVETEKALEKMQGIRTMAQDLKEAEAHKPQTSEAVYQSSQSDLLRPGAGAAGSNTPRWETDN